MKDLPKLIITGGNLVWQPPTKNNPHPKPLIPPTHQADVAFTVVAGSDGLWLPPHTDQVHPPYLKDGTSTAHVIRVVGMVDGQDLAGWVFLSD